MNAGFVAHGGILAHGDHQQCLLAISFMLDHIEHFLHFFRSDQVVVLEVGMNNIPIQERDRTTSCFHHAHDFHREQVQS